MQLQGNGWQRIPAGEHSTTAGLFDDADAWMKRIGVKLRYEDTGLEPLTEGSMKRLEAWAPAWAMGLWAAAQVSSQGLGWSVLRGAVAVCNRDPEFAAAVRSIHTTSGAALLEEFLYTNVRVLQMGCRLADEREVKGEAVRGVRS